MDIVNLSLSLSLVLGRQAGCRPFAILQQPGQSLCHAASDERHLLLEWPALADVRNQYSQLIARCSGIMARLLWFKDQQGSTAPSDPPGAEPLAPAD